MSSQPTDRTAPLHLWRIARAFLDKLHALFGAPEDIAAQHTLTAKPYQLLLKWLRAAEALMRHLLLIEAAAYPRPNTRPLLHPQRTRARRLMGFSADAPEDWRVSFRCLATDSRLPAGPRSLRHSEKQPARRFFSAWPLAERMEALIRVFNTPAPYAARLARRLHATPHRARELLTHAADTAALIGAEAFEKIISEAAGIATAYDSS